MILVDSSVWIDVLRNRDTRQAAAFRDLLAERQVIGVADLVAVEILQGAGDKRDFEATRATLSTFPSVRTLDEAVVIAAAQHYRYLRSLGITVRKTIDTLIATRCIIGSIPLLYSDRDFDPFVQHLGLRSALGVTGAN